MVEQALARLKAGTNNNRAVFSDEIARKRQALAPAEETAAGAGIGPARVRVLEVDGEVFDATPAGRVAVAGARRMGAQCRVPG